MTYRSVVKNNKGFKPPLSKDKHLDSYISRLRNTVNSMIVKLNISQKSI